MKEFFLEEKKYAGNLLSLTLHVPMPSSAPTPKDSSLDEAA
jgi:hypothetical protein